MGTGMRAAHRKMLLEALAEELTPGIVCFSSKLASIKTEGLEDSSNLTILHLEDGTIIRTNKELDMVKDFARDPSLILGEVTDNLAKEFPQAYLDVVQHSDPSSLSWAPLMLRAPWAVIVGPNHKGAVTVAGDAMHPMTPDLGPGGCSALVDAVVLARNIGHALSSEGRIISQEKVEERMKIYVKERRWRVAGSYLSGWVQQGWSGLCVWAVRFVRDHLFYRFFYPRISGAVQYDCGPLQLSDLDLCICWNK